MGSLVSIILFGDECQSIYKFRGANLLIFKNVILENSYFTIHKLTKSFRGNKEISKFIDLFRVDKVPSSEKELILFFEMMINYKGSSITPLHYSVFNENKCYKKLFDYTLIKQSINKGNEEVDILFNKIKGINEIKNLAWNFEKILLNNSSVKNIVTNNILLVKLGLSSFGRIKEFLLDKKYSEKKVNKIIDFLHEKEYLDVNKKNDLININFIKEYSDKIHNNENGSITISSSKGTEYKKVAFFIDINKFFKFYKFTNIENCKDQINNIYVALSRSKEKLIIIYNWKRK